MITKCKKIIFSVAACSISFCSLGEQSNSQLDKLDSIMSMQQVRVCIWPDYYRISFRNPRTFELEGIDIDMAHALASHLNVSLEFIDSSFADLARNITEGKCDIAMHGVGIREDRKVYMDFTTPHLRSGIYAVTRKNNQQIQEWSDIDQPGNIVVVQKGTYMEPVMKDKLQQAELSIVDTFMGREQEVLSGRADVFMTDYPYGLRMAHLTDWASLISPPEPFALTDYAYAVPKNEDRWLAAVNQFIEKVKEDGTLAKFAAKHELEPIVVLTNN
ncbi:MAG: amino acid ABC transporter substrate-binding protein [Oceanospirillales bacterium]|nr:MAG: amino acid ABC transporter substrate-binding protein [Oceanospirillales bacterium]